MTRHRRRVTVDELANIVGELTDQLKVLVAAVDDLRCEVEWWARNAAAETTWQPVTRALSGDAVTNDEHRSAEESVEPSDSTPSANVPAVDGHATATAKEAATTSACDSAVSATALDRLAALEQALSSGPCCPWPETCEDSECPEFPVGTVVLADEDLWLAMLELRPAHVLEYDCCCEDGIGAPYLLAWQRDDGCFLRELSESEAIDLQRACLAAQAEREAQRPAAPSPQTQLDLW